MLGRDTQRFSGIGDDDEASLLASLASRYYLGRGDRGIAELPRDILFPGDFEDREVLAEILTEARGRAVRIAVPKRGDKKRLVELAGANARHAMEDRVTALRYAADRADEALYNLQDHLDLKVVPRVIVGFDISHIQGSETVASVVTFENGEPKRAGYRHMRIRGEWGNDDFRSMAEAVTRYFRGLLDGQKPLPDLVVRMSCIPASFLFTVVAPPDDPLAVQFREGIYQPVENRICYEILKKVSSFEPQG